MFYKYTRGRGIEFTGEDAFWGQIVGGLIGAAGSLVSTGISVEAQKEIAEAQIAAARENLDISIAANQAIAGAQISASWAQFYAGQRAQYDIFNKSMEAEYDIYNATQAAEYQRLTEQFEYQKTADLETAKAGVGIAKIEAEALRLAAQEQAKANLAAAGIAATAAREAGRIEAAGLRRAANLEYKNAQFNIKNMVMEFTEDLRRTKNQNNAIRAEARALQAASGGTMGAGTSANIYYTDLSGELKAQYDWLTGAYDSQVLAARTMAEDLKQLQYEEAADIMKTVNIQNSALWETAKIQNAAMLKDADIKGNALIQGAETTLAAVETIYSREYYTPPKVIEYEPISMPGGGGGGGGGGGFSGGGGGGGGSAEPEPDKPKYTDIYYEVTRTGGGKKITVGEEYIEFYTAERNYDIGQRWGTDASGNKVRLSRSDEIRETLSNKKNATYNY